MNVRSEDPLGRHADRLDALPVAIVTRLNIASVACVRKRLPSMCRVGGMYLTGQSGNSSRVSCACAHSQQQAVRAPACRSRTRRRARSGASGTPLARASWRLMNCEAVTDGRRPDRVGGAQVVVLAGVDRRRRSSR